MPLLWESKMRERKRVVLTDSWRRFLAAEWVMYWAATSPTPQRTPELMTWVFTGWTERQFWYQCHSFNIILILCYALLLLFLTNLREWWWQTSEITKQEWDWKSIYLQIEIVQVLVNCPFPVTITVLIMGLQALPKTTWAFIVCVCVGLGINKENKKQKKGDLHPWTFHDQQKKSLNFLKW